MFLVTTFAKLTRAIIAANPALYRRSRAAAKPKNSRAARIAGSGKAFFAPIAIALAITALLFLLMKGLISNEQPQLDERPMGATTFVPLIEDQPVKGTTQKPERTIIESPPRTNPLARTRRWPVEFTEPDARSGKPLVSRYRWQLSAHRYCAPEYPRRMASRGIGDGYS